jgi:hypothetical protein
MKRIGTAVTVLVAALALAALSAASAVAFPVFTVLPSVRRYEISMGTSKFSAGQDTVSCERGVGVGEITGMFTFGMVVLELFGCKSSGSSESGCPVNSLGAREGEIVTNTLRGEFGTVKSTEAATEVGVFVVPQGTSEWLTLASNACTPEVSVEGSIAGEAGPTKTLTNMGFVNFEVASGAGKSEKIKAIHLLSGTKDPSLQAFGQTVTFTRYELLEAAGNIEIS